MSTGTPITQEESDRLDALQADWFKNERIAEAYRTGDFWRFE